MNDEAASSHMNAEIEPSTNRPVASEKPVAPAVKAASRLARLRRGLTRVAGVIGGLATLLLVLDVSLTLWSFSSNWSLGMAAIGARGTATGTTAIQASQVANVATNVAGQQFGHTAMLIGALIIGTMGLAQIFWKHRPRVAAMLFLLAMVCIISVSNARRTSAASAGTMFGAGPLVVGEFRAAAVRSSVIGFIFGAATVVALFGLGTPRAAAAAPLVPTPSRETA